MRCDIEIGVDIILQEESAKSLNIEQMISGVKVA
jgi:hypothetical protein